MDILRFTLSGSQAFFKNPDVNAYNYYTFGHVHKVALLGILGAINGFAGYNQMDKKSVYPEFYEKLKDIQISIVPICNKGKFKKKIISFNNSVGYASKEEGGNLIVRQQWLEEPKWDIYILIDNDIIKEVCDNMLNNRCVYIPYLGSNDHLADISNVRIVKGNIIEDFLESDNAYLNSLYLKKFIDVDLDDDESDGEFKYEETLPISLDKEFNLYEYEKFGLSDLSVIRADKEIWKVEDTDSSLGNDSVNIMFY